MRFSGHPPSSLLRLIRCISPTSTCPPSHRPRRTFSTAMTPYSLICRIFATTTTRLSDPKSSLLPNSFFLQYSGSSKDANETNSDGVYIRYIQMRSAYTRGCNCEAHIHGCSTCWSTFDSLPSSRFFLHWSDDPSAGLFSTPVATGRLLCWSCASLLLWTSRVWSHVSLLQAFSASSSLQGRT